ncbi:hypothetical protein DER30_3992 [Streptomyces sp. HB202]|nr:hypothetical protein DER30_3992 [Streptomyces sp. HB202]
MAALRLTGLGFGDNRLITDLGLLASVVPDLEFLHFTRCSAIEDFGPLADYARLESFGLRHCGISRLDALPPLPHALFLGMEESRPLTLRGLASWEQLTSLAVSRLASFADAAAELREHGGVLALRLAEPPSAADCATLAPLPSVQRLMLDTTPADGQDLPLLQGLFPSLRALELSPGTGCPAGSLDALRRSWPELEVTVAADEQGAAPDRP